jgi:hypothetical protein
MRSAAVRQQGSLSTPVLTYRRFGLRMAAASSFAPAVEARTTCTKSRRAEPARKWRCSFHRSRSSPPTGLRMVGLFCFRISTRRMEAICSCCRLKATASPCRSCRRRSTNHRRSSRPTGDGWRISQTSQGDSRLMSYRFRARMPSFRFPPAAGPSRAGGATAGSFSTSLPTAD